MAGFVYVMSNEAFAPNLLKIGKSARDPTEFRKQELESTGVPAPFVVEYYVLLEEFDDLELLVHRTLALRRKYPNREFFEVGLEEAVSLVRELAAGRVLFERFGNRLLEIQAKPFDEQTKSAEIHEIFSTYQLTRDVDPLATLQVICPLSRPFESSLSINGLEIFLKELFEKYCCWIDQLSEIGQSAEDYKAAFGIRKKGIWEQFFDGWNAADPSSDSLRSPLQKRPVLHIGCVRTEAHSACENENALICIQIHPATQMEFHVFKCITDLYRENGTPDFKDFGTPDFNDNTYFIGDLGPEVLVDGPLLASITTDAEPFLGKIEGLGEGYWSTYWCEIAKGCSSQRIGGAWETKELLNSSKSIEQTTKLLCKLLRDACPNNAKLRLFGLQVFTDEELIFERHWLRTLSDGL